MYNDYEYEISRLMDKVSKLDDDLYWITKYRDQLQDKVYELQIIIKELKETLAYLKNEIAIDNLEHSADNDSDDEEYKQRRMNATDMLDDCPF